MLYARGLYMSVSNQYGIPTWIFLFINCLGTIILVIWLFAAHVSSTYGRKVLYSALSRAQQLPKCHGLWNGHGFLSFFDDPRKSSFIISVLLGTDYTKFLLPNLGTHRFVLNFINLTAPRIAPRRVIPFPGFKTRSFPDERPNQFCSRSHTIGSFSLLKPSQCVSRWMLTSSKWRTKQPIRKSDRHSDASEQANTDILITFLYSLYKRGMSQWQSQRINEEYPIENLAITMATWGCWGIEKCAEALAALPPNSNSEGSIPNWCWITSRLYCTWWKCDYTFLICVAIFPSWEIMHPVPVLWLPTCILYGILCARIFRRIRTSFEFSDSMYHLLLPSWIFKRRPTFRRDILRERLHSKAYQSAGAASNMTHQRGIAETSWLISFVFCRISNGCIEPIKAAFQAEFAKLERAAVGQHLSCPCLSAKRAPTASQNLGPLIDDNACFASLDATGTPQSRRRLARS